jgi:hypothetical protein
MDTEIVIEIKTKLSNYLEKLRQNREIFNFSITDDEIIIFPLPGNIEENVKFKFVVK